MSAIEPLVQDFLAQKRIAMVVIQAPAGERRNWPVIRSWAAALPAALQLERKTVAVS